MTTGERIRQLRIEHQMTQEELGARVGVQKAAIYKYENGLVVNLKRSILEKLAIVLDTTPTYLMGMEDSEQQANMQLTPQQSTLLAAFDQLNDEGQTKAVEYVEDLVLTGRYKKCPASGLGRSGYTKAADQYMEKSSCFRPMTTQMPAKSPMLCKSYPPKINPPTKSLFSG